MTEGWRRVKKYSTPLLILFCLKPVDEIKIVRNFQFNSALEMHWKVHCHVKVYKNSLLYMFFLFKRLIAWVECNTPEILSLNLNPVKLTTYRHGFLLFFLNVANSMISKIRSLVLSEFYGWTMEKCLEYEVQSHSHLIVLKICEHVTFLKFKSIFIC